MGSGDSDETAVSNTEPMVGGPAPRLSLPNYGVGDVIGRGGMGEVLLARDRRIGRDVAIKRMVHGEPTEADTARFLREAKIQARLEHPAIVPVHEIGEDANGRPYFTMKKLSGTTLHDKLRAGDETPQRLLRAFVDVCRAIELAHANNVIHRDLKPGNIMLGGFGEVYVLDWGVARVMSERGKEPDSLETIAPVAGETAAGSMLGTAGYMPPEQMSDASTVGPKADVYALGATLFEILTGEPLHQRGAAAVASTLAAKIDPPSVRRPDKEIPPELDRACVDALATEPADRPNARELGDRVQRYLDGDRDLEQRRILAAESFAKATAAAKDPARRAEAVHEAGRAVALDPKSDALGLVTRLLVEPPEKDPPALTTKLAELDKGIAAGSASVAARMLLAFFVLLPLFAWTGVENWPFVIAVTAYVVVSAAWAHHQSRSRKTYNLLALLISSGLCMLMSRLSSPYLITPLLLSVMLSSLATQPQNLDRPALLVLAIGLAGLLLPVAAELLGIVPSSVAVSGDTVTFSSEILHLEGLPTYVLMLVPNVLIISLGAMFSRMHGLALRTAQRELARREWHLEQLLPAK